MKTLQTTPQTMTTRQTPKPQTITAHFNELKRAVAEARKYGVIHTYEAILQQIHLNGKFVHHITADRDLVLTKVNDHRWKLAIEVQGRVVPVDTMPKAFVSLLQQPQFG